MKFSILSCSFLACVSPLVSATALTYKLSANEKACFFSNVENKGAKIAFYFAVCASFTSCILATILIRADVGSSRRIFRCWIRGRGPQWQDNHGWKERATGRLCLHSWRDGRIQVLLQQRNEHLFREVCGLRDRCTFSKLPLFYDPSNDNGWHVLSALIRLRTKSAHLSQRSKAHLLNRHLRWRNLYSSSQANSRRSQGTRSTSARERTGISARLEVRRGESSTSVLLRAWWWYAWRDCRCLLCGSSSRYVALFALTLWRGLWLIYVIGSKERIRVNC